MNNNQLKILDTLLLQYSNFDRGDNTEKFLDTVDQIVTTLDAQLAFPVLLKYFDDNTEYSWVLESLCSALETYNDIEYVQQMLISMAILSPHANEWAKNMLYGILNNPQCLKILKENLKLANKEVILLLFQQMKQESPHHHELIESLEQELK